MWASAETLGPIGAKKLLASGADEVLVPCIGHLDQAAAKAAAVAGGPATLHVPANRVTSCQAAVDLLVEHGLQSALVVSGNPGHGRGDFAVYELIRCLRAQGIHVSVGAYPESYFSVTSTRHRAKSARILADKQAAGAQRIITQASFDAQNMAEWRRRIRDQGVELPVQVGLMAPVPRRALRATLRSARAELFRHPRLSAVSRENLDMLYRMLRSRIPDPARFVRAVADTGELGAGDGFHIFTYGADVSDVITTIHGLGHARQRSEGEIAGA